MRVNNCWMDRWMKSRLPTLVLYSLEESSAPLSCSSLPVTSSQTDTWPFGAMETPQIFCVYSAFILHPTLFQSLPHIFKEWFLQNANLVISVFWLKSSVVPYFSTSVEILWKEQPKQPPPSLPPQSTEYPTNTLCHLLPLCHTLSHPHASGKAVTSACKNPLSLTWPSAAITTATSVLKNLLVTPAKQIYLLLPVLPLLIFPICAPMLFMWLGQLLNHWLKTLNLSK